MHPDKLEELSLQSIANFAKLDAKVSSLEISVNLMRSENSAILKEISASLAKSAAIAEQIAQNAAEHQIIHKRVDDNRNAVDALETKITQINMQCAAADHADMEIKVAHMNTTVEEMYRMHQIITKQILGIEIWVILVGIVLFGLVSDIVNHYEFFKAWFK